MERRSIANSAILVALAAVLGCAQSKTVSSESSDGRVSQGDVSSRASRSPAQVSDFLTARTLPEPKSRHVYMLHLDGFHGQVFEKMLAAGQLPHFRFLAEHGRFSTHASTVDKSETMKVIPSYLSSKVDTRITGWWQFDRSRMGYSNFWIDPVEVVNYALGLDFPMYPTVLDVMARDKQEAVSGFSLFRRGVKYKNYSRIYLEGIDAVYSYRYYRQADASASALVDLIRTRAKEGKPPRLVTSLLAAADEMTHLNGLTTREQDQGNPKNYCVDRKGTKPIRPTDDVFDILERSKKEKDGIVFVGRTYMNGKIQYRDGLGHFTRVQSRDSKISRVCFDIQSATSAVSEAEKRDLYLYPEVALAYLVVDMQLGRIINGLRGVTFDGESGKSQVTEIDKGIEKYLLNGRLENSLFERSLFLFYGDHGMVNTPKEMNPPLGLEAEKINRDPASFDKPFARVLAEALDLSVYVGDHKFGDGDELVVDYQNLPPRLKQPDSDLSWQSPEIRRMSDEARVWADDFFAKAMQAVKDSAYEKYWWLLFLKYPIVDTQVDSSMTSVRKQAIPALIHLYLQGNKEYVAAEKEANRAYYEKHVPVVYGGSALNNADLFLPTIRNGKRDWSQRPTFEEILGYRSGELLKRVQKIPGVGLIFIRRQNSVFTTDAALPPKLEILVMDKKGGEGWITITVDPASKERIYHYRVAPGRSDPLGYGDLGAGEGTYGTYSQWNQWSVERGHFNHNAVAGMGSYLYSSSPAVGDISIMHEVGWNFGENLGGHGGLESGEKITVMLASGPGVEAGGELRSKASYVAHPDGTLALKPFSTTPTVLDAAPTALAYLGYPVENGEGELTRFSRDGFAAYLRDWTDYQKTICAKDGTQLISLLAEQNGIGFKADFKKVLQGQLARLCQFMNQEHPDFPDYESTKEDGNVLILNGNGEF